MSGYRNLLFVIKILLCASFLTGCITTESALKDKVTSLWQGGKYKKAFRTTRRFIKRHRDSLIARELMIKISLRMEDRQNAIHEYLDFKNHHGRHSSQLLELLAFGFNRPDISGEDIKLSIACLNSDEDAASLLEEIEKNPSLDSIFFALRFSGKRFFPSLIPLFEYTMRNLDTSFKRAALFSMKDIEGELVGEIAPLFLNDKGELIELLPLIMMKRGDEKGRMILEELALRGEGLSSYMAILALPVERSNFLEEDEGGSQDKLLVRKFSKILSRIKEGGLKKVPIQTMIEDETGKNEGDSPEEQKKEHSSPPSNEGSHEEQGRDNAKSPILTEEEIAFLRDAHDILPPSFQILGDVLLLQSGMIETPQKLELFDEFSLQEKRSTLLLLMSADLPSSSIYWGRLLEEKNFIERSLLFEILPLTCPTFASEIIREGLKDENENIRKLAVQCLVQCGGANDLPLLKEILYMKDTPLKVALMEEVGFKRDYSFLPLLKRGLSDGSPFVRESAIESLGSFCSDDVVPLLEIGLKDENEEVSKKSALALYLYSLKKEKEMKKKAEEEKEKANKDRKNR